MRRDWQCLTFMLLLLVSFKLLAAQERAGGPLRIDEDKISLQLLPETQLDVAFINSSSHVLEGALLLEMLQSNGAVGASVKRDFRASPGTSIERVPWAAANLPSNSPSALGWYRLRYTLTPTKGPAFPPVRGVVQLGRFMTDAFEVRITGAGQAAYGAKYPVRIRVDNPGTARPCAGVPVEVQLEIDDDDDRVITQKVVTDRSGYAVTVFDLPRNFSFSKGEVTAAATRGPFSEEQSIRFEFLKQPNLSITTDKPLYQPGQTVHMRLLGFGFDRQAWAGASIKLTIEDEDGQEEFHSTLTTSSFGVATADWEVPQKLRLGDYWVAAEIQTQGNDSVEARSKVRVSRYELPGFTVKAAPDRSYYLPGQDAQIEIRADYLFGKPVQRGRVKVVRQDERHWNFKEQKWEVEESAAAEGELDSSGRFMAHFSLAKDFDDFSESRYNRFEDLTLAAHVTDLSTGRTEQRRFRLRLSGQAIHLYFTTGARLPAGEPVLAYVTSSYADGTPASVHGTIEAALPDASGKFDDDPDSAHRITIGKFHTNRLGVAKVELPALAENLLITSGWYGYRSYLYDDYYDDDGESIFKPSRSAQLLLRASDAKGLTGSDSEELLLTGETEYMRVSTDRSLYHPGEAIHATILSNTWDGDVIVNVSTEEGLLASQVARLKRGRAELTMPYDPKFRGQINIIAYAMTEATNEARALAGEASVIYPWPQELRVGIRMPRTTLRPGETVKADLEIKSPEGEAAQSDLGVLVFDRAVAERVRSDEEFGSEYGFSIFDYFFPDYQNSIAGITYRDLLNLDASKPFADGVDLAAELLLRSSLQYSTGEVELSGGAADYGRSAAAYFQPGSHPQVKRVKALLDGAYASGGDYPKNEAEYRAVLRAGGIDPEDVRDPWDIPYRAVFSVSGAYDVMSLISSGVDKRQNTADDFAATRFRRRYFRKIGEAIEIATARYQEHTGKYIRDYVTLRDELKKANIDLDSLRDPWGSRYLYTFPISGPFFEIRVESAGPDKRFDTQVLRSPDDVHEWTSSIHYFQQETDDLNRALAVHFAETGKFPQNEEELKPVLKAANLTAARLVDPWGRPYQFNFSSGSRYWDQVKTRTYSEYPNQPQAQRTEITPVTQELAYIQVVSCGPENKPAAFAVAEFSRVIAERSSKDIRSMATPKEPPRRGGRGGIFGTVTDQTGAVIPGATVVAISSDSGRQYTAQTDSAGNFSFPILLTGIYRLEFLKPGFQIAVVIRVPVQAAATTRVDSSLSVGAATETVEVTAQPPSVETTTATVSGKRGEPGTPSAQEEKPIFTPRLRKYFPETLLWRPEIISDRKGRARISFPMADNITAWKMSVVASTREGKVGIAEKELRTFQPFFIEDDPPRVLTEGDRISLPVVLRNYTKKTQTVKTELQPEAWFSILSPPQQRVTIPPNGNASAVFSFRAKLSTQKGAQRVTARNANTGDAVEREVAVHPDGQEISLTVARVLSGKEDTLEMEIPALAIHGSEEAELRIYPNLLAHVLDALHALSQHPGGCFEQITSLGYGNLLALEAWKKAGEENPGPGSRQAAGFAEAKKAVRNTVDLLTAGQNADGGFAYWKGLQSDVALTAYVLRFLSRAGKFAEVNAEITGKARAYLLSRQSSAGAWRSFDWRLKRDADNPNLTAYVARALAVTNADVSDKQRAQADHALAQAMTYLEGTIGSWNDAYLVGNYAIAAAALGGKERMAKAQSELARLVHMEGAGSYWNLEANTSPFYGWGNGGRLEATALAVEALAMMHAASAAAGDSTQISRGLEYLLNHKDRYAMWYSSQATENVIEAMITALPPAHEQINAFDAAIMVNGKEVSHIKAPPADAVTGPITVQLRGGLKAGENKIRVVRPGDASAMDAALLASYYVPRSHAPATAEENLATGDTRALRLKVRFDRTDAMLGDPVRCHVEAERIGFRGYGMMLAEIGLPPGADVDRASLEKAKDSGPINAYEVRPDRVVLYLWPQAGGSSFDFQFRMRFRMEAMSAPSLLYDFYNPDANAAVAPVRFRVR